MKQNALGHIRVIDLSRILAGPFCTQTLGDLGAEIIKIERPCVGDDTRKWGPPYMKDAQGENTSESAYYLCANRNKKSIAIDIKSAEGQEIIHALLAQSDVLIENFKTGGLAQYGLGYAQIQERHPHLVYCSITGFGLNGPMAQEAGYDFLAQGMSGLMDCTGAPDGEPMKVGVALSDVMSGLYAAIGILAALQARDKTGKGQLVDLALLDCSLASLTNIAQYFLTSGAPSPRLGNAHSTIVPYQTFATNDGHIILAIGNDQQFRHFCTAICKDDWAQDERFAKNSARVKNRTILVPMIADIIQAESQEYWLALLPEHHVPAGSVNRMDQVFDMEQIQAREMKISMDHDLAGEPIDLVGSPLKLSDTPVAYDRAPPYLGQHTTEVLKEILNLDEKQIKSLIENKTIQSH